MTDRTKIDTDASNKTLHGRPMITVCLWSRLIGGGISIMADLTQDEAQELVNNIQKALSRVPRIANGADLGISP